MLSSQKHKEFMKQLELVKTQQMMNDNANWDSWESSSHYYQEN
jgi:hypothetical protein